MRKIAASALIALCVGCLGSASAAAEAPPADLPEAVAAMQAVRAVTLSARGRVLAWIQSDAAQRDALVYHHAVRRVQRVFHIDRRKEPSALRWGGSDMPLQTVTMPIHLRAPGVNVRGLIERILALDIKTGQAPVPLLSGNDIQYVTAARLALADSHRPHGVIMFRYAWPANAYRSSTGTLIHGSRGDSGWRGNLFAVAPRSGNYRVIGHGNAFTIGWVVRRGASSAELRDSRRPLGVTPEGGRNRYRWLDPAAQVRYASVARAFPGIPLRVYAASRNGTEVLAEVCGPVIAPICCLSDCAAHRAMLVGQSYPQLAPARNRSIFAQLSALGGARRLRTGRWRVRRERG